MYCTNQNRHTEKNSHRINRKWNLCAKKNLKKKYTHSRSTERYFLCIAFPIRNTYDKDPGTKPKGVYGNQSATDQNGTTYYPFKFYLYSARGISEKRLDWEWFSAEALKRLTVLEPRDPVPETIRRSQNKENRAEVRGRKQDEVEIREKRWLVAPWFTCGVW